MHQTKLIQILSRFDKNEARQFEAFLESPFFNTSGKLVAFYKILMQHHPEFDSPKLSKEKIYQKLHGKLEYNDQTMRELISDLFKLAKEFIPHMLLKKNPIGAGNERYVWFYQKGLIKLSEQELTHCNEMLGNDRQKDYEYYYQRWVTDYNEYHHRSEVLRDKEHKLFKDKEFGHQIHSLNKYYLLHSLESYIFMLGVSKIYNTPLELRPAGHLEELGAQYTGQGDLVIDVFYNIYQLLKSGDEKYFFELKSILMSGMGVVEKPVLIELSINLQNYSIQKLREGDSRFGPEIAELMRFVVDGDLMMEGGEVPYSFYKNVTTIGLEFLDLSWVKAFAEKYKPFLPEPFREEVYNFSRAYMLFAERQYEAALRITTELCAFNDFTKIDIKNLTAKLQYELGMFDQLNILLDSYQHHLSRETVTSSRKNAQTPFIRMMRQLVALNLNYSADAWKKLSADINEISAFTSKRWFLEKVQEMSRRHQHQAA